MINSTIIWSPGMTLEHLIEQAIKAAMVFHKGNKTAVAHSLGIAVRTLDNKLEKYAKESGDHGARIEREREKRADFLRRQRGDHYQQSADNGTMPSIHAKAVAERARRQHSSEAHIPNATARLRSEPIANASTQQPVPVPQQKEIQAVLPQNAAGTGNRKNG